jgi:N-acetylglucosaminyl-diphospho-decaprenol L-rhamnosyltransferase
MALALQRRRIWHASSKNPRSVPEIRTPAEKAPRLSVVIINYRQWEETSQLVQELSKARSLRTGAAEVIIIDNHSPPHPLAAKLRRRPGLSIRRWGRNRGFACAVNEGYRLGRGQWLLVLNPDLTPAKGFLDGAVALADRLSQVDPRAGIVGFQLRNRDGTLQWSAGSFPSLAGTLAGLAWPRTRRKCRPIRTPKRCRVPWVTGCCLLVRGECLRQLGGLDEDYFLYYEDVDLCRRARAKGWTVWYEPALQAIHHRPLHGRPVPSTLRLLTRHALMTYGAKHWPRWQFRVITDIIRLEARIRHYWMRWKGKHHRAAHYADLERIALDLQGGNPSAARRRLRRFVDGWQVHE